MIPMLSIKFSPIIYSTMPRHVTALTFKSSIGRNKEENHGETSFQRPTFQQLVRMLVLCHLGIHKSSPLQDDPTQSNRRKPSKWI